MMDRRQSTGRSRQGRKVGLLFITLLVAVHAAKAFTSFVPSHFNKARQRTFVPSQSTRIRQPIGVLSYPLQLSLSVSSTMDSKTPLINSNGESIPNWRVLTAQDCSIPSPSENGSSSTTTTTTTSPKSASSILHTRATWSTTQYQSALQLYETLMTMDDDVYISKSIHQALACLENALRLYQPNNIICSFNGGKDAVVILHLLRAALAKYYHQSTKEDKDGNDLPPLLQRPRVIYFDHEHEFPEMNDFLQETVQAYDLDMIAFDANITFAQGLKLLVDNNILPNTPASPAYPMAFILGTRESDPNAHAQGYFAPSSSNYMPPFMRVNPIWHWNYGHVWHFLRLLNLPYCSLYDQGYTSLGTTLNTLPCPALQVAGMTMIDATTKQEVPKYWPAYMLRDYDQERAGRVASSSSNAAAASKKKQNGTVKQEGNEGGGFQSLKTSSSNLDQLSNLDDGTLNETTAAEDGEEASVVSFGSDSYRQKSVGLLVIGDEILKGFTHDTNTQAAAKALFGQNVVLKRVVVVSDKQDAIVQEIHRLQKEVDVIITSGGVGPTHDDVTIKSVAQALETEMIIHEEMAQLLKDKMNDGDPSAELSEAQLKMATLPSSSKLRYLSGPTNWPVLQVRNIFVLPGVPEFFEAKIEDVSRYLSCQLERSVAYKVVLSVDENSIVPVLNAVVENHPSVSFGSYPFVSHPDYKTVITVEGRLLTNMTRSNSSYFNPSDLIVGRSPKEDLDKHVQVALDELITSLPSGSVLRVDNDDLLL